MSKRDLSAVEDLAAVRATLADEGYADPKPMTLAQAAKAVAELAEAHDDSTGLAVRAWSHKGLGGRLRHSNQTIEVWSAAIGTHLEAPTLASVVEVYRLALENRATEPQPLETMGPAPTTLTNERTTK